MLDSPLQQIVCCMGQPVAGNPTQFMMQRAFAAARLEWVYLTLEVAPVDLQDAVRGLRAMGFRGANFTIPHKVAVTQHLDELTETAALMGAVNCVYREEDRLIGENTDGKGFVQSLADVGGLSGKKVLLLGAGGAARAIAVEVGLAGAEQISVSNRTAEHGQMLVDLLNDKVPAQADLLPWQDKLKIPEQTDILINATPVGLLDADAELPLDLDTLETSTVVADVIINPPETWLLREAERRGCPTVNGLGMLVHQGIITFELWTGIKPDAVVMREAVEEFLEI